MAGAVTRIGAAAAARAALEAVDRGDDIAVVLVLAPSAQAGARLLIARDGTTRGTLGEPALDAAAGRLAQATLDGAGPGVHTLEVSQGDVTVYVEAVRAPDRLVVVGAGHIAVPLAMLGVELGFEVTVLDDREEFATGERFARGVRVLRADFETDPFAGVPLGPRSHIALVTRGHRWDFDCLRRLLERGERPRYIGMIGSRRRVLAAFGALLEAGFPRAVLAEVHAPIGLDIGAETPAEIAVSIAAELIHARRGGSAQSLTIRERVLDRLLKEP